MRSFFSGDGYRLRFGTLHVRIVVSPKAFLVTAAIISALALTPNFKRVETAEVSEPRPRPVVSDVSNRMPSSPLSVKSPSGAPGINDLLYLEDFGSNLYTIDSMTGVASLAASDSAGVYSSAVERTANAPGAPLNNAPVAWGPLPALVRVSSTQVTRRSTERGAHSTGDFGGGGFVGGSPGSPAPGHAPSPDGNSDSAPPASGPPVADDGDRQSPDLDLPDSIRSGPINRYSATGSSGLSAHGPPIRKGEPSDNPAEDANGNLSSTAKDAFFRNSELFLASTSLSVTAFSASAPPVSQTASVTLAEELSQSLEARVSFDSPSPVPEPRSTLLFLLPLLLITRRWCRHPSNRHHSVRRYNTGQKRAHSVSEAQPMLKTLTLFTALVTISAFAPSAFAQKDLPDGAGKPATVRVCTGCHGAEMFSATRLGQAEWDRMIANMTTERGVAITDADYATVLKYLSTYLAPPKANLSKAPDVK